MSIQIKAAAILAIVCGAIASAQPVHARGTVVTSDASQDWAHEPSGITVPSVLAGMARGEIRDLSESLHDVFIQFRTADDQSFATLYLYRTGYRDLGLWFDQSYSAISTNPVLGAQSGGTRTPNLVSLFGEQTPDSGLVTFPVEGDYRSTGLGLTERNGWLIKVRLSSLNMTPDENRVAIRSLITGLQLPDQAIEAAPPANMRECDELLSYTDARTAEATMELSLAGALMLATSATEIRIPSCRDQRFTPTFAAYRAGDGDSGYVVALGDSGKVAQVSQSLTGAESNIYQVDYHGPEEAMVVGFFEGMPTPQQAVAAVSSVLEGAAHPYATVAFSSPDGATAITVDSSLTGDATE
ncbi:hypothetical protein HFP51_04780 [Parasphingopyxis sp. CP4]|uniref:hypothetical protein n=1 Tax=Parasphingopyxis sp. CP4 TaxID=2724527 RepID=UPI0015A4C492|nr:hypothetical protein [Parasphingopyxis sp. CP4]QLC21553.1 hypothetical protein HFP51_04780 [Parasphingopyxis sp. CP4]